MPSLEDLLATRRTAVKALEEEQRNLQSTTDYKDAVQDAVDTAWRAAAGGVALAQADDDPQFRGTLTAVLEELISGKRNRNILAEWKAGTPQAPEGAPAAAGASKHDGNLRRRRKAAMRRELDALSPDELLEKLDQVEADQRRQTRTSPVPVRRPRRWPKSCGAETGAGGSSSACPSSPHAGKHPDFRRKLDDIFTQRITEKDRVLLDRWRNKNAATTASPPPADDALTGWVPRTLPDKVWGAALLNPAGKDLPPELVGLSIRVTPRKGDPWVTRIIEVIESTDDRILVRHQGRPGFPAPAANAPATPPPDDHAAAGTDAHSVRA